MPSSRRQISATASAFAASRTKPGAPHRGALDEQRDRVARRDGVATSASAPDRQRPQRHDAARPSTPSAFAARREDAHVAGTPEASPRRDRPAASSEVLAVVEHEQQRAWRAGTRRCSPPSVRRRTRRAPRASAATTCDHRLGVGRRRELARATRRRGSCGSTSAATWTARRRLADAADAGERDEPRLVERRRRPRRSRRSRPTNDVSCSGRLPGNASSERSGGNVARRGRDARAGTRARPREVAQPVLAEVDEHAARQASVVADQLLGRQRQHDLPAVRDAHEPGGAVDRACRSSRRRAARPAPVWTPMRTRSGPVASQAPPTSARCASTAASTASRRGREHRVHAVARRLHDVPAVRLDRVAAGSRRGAPARACIASGAPPRAASSPRGR